VYRKYGKGGVRERKERKEVEREKEKR